MAPVDRHELQVFRPDVVRAGADDLVVLALLQWLNGYLGMVPTAAQLSAREDTPLEASGRAYLKRIGWSTTWGADVTEACPDLMLASSAVATRCVGEGQAVAGIELSQPAAARIDVIPKALLGSNGTLFLLERILNEAARPRGVTGYLETGHAYAR